ncbi:LamG domain-containing protein [Salinimonas lutimaris]|uniref:LamG domain-containing protein n=1 Tax=Salinimonas lutimaris TaxID=914153 RepID=UPI0010BFB9E5|nr:LamG domain-containing protein [Salinimonas lutimaris]
MKVVYAVVLLIFTGASIAQECTAVFPDPASSSFADGTIDFKNNSQVIGSDGSLDAPNITGGDTACDGSQCQSSGQTAEPLVLPAFENSAVTAKDKTAYPAVFSPGDYGQLSLKNADTAIFNAGEYRISSLDLGKDAQVVLASGVYWIDTLTLGNGASLIVAPGEEVLLYVNTLDVNNGAQMNSAGSSDQLTIINYDSARFKNSSDTSAFIFSQGTITLDNSARVLGAVSARDIELKNSSVIEYDTASFDRFTAGGLCEATVTVPSPVAHWPINVCTLAGDDNQVPELITGNDGQGVNSPGVEDNGRFCQAGSFRGDDDTILLPHSTDYAISEGAIAFWFNTDNLQFSRRSSAGGMALFSKDAQGLSDHITISLLQNGAIRVAHSSLAATRQINANAGIQENTWYYLVYTFGPQGMQLFINAALVGSNIELTSGILNNGEPIVLAANAGLTASGSAATAQLTDFYRGKIDDVQLYDEQLSGSQIESLFGKEAETCVSCETQTELVSHWDFDVCSLTGADDVVDVQGVQNGTARGGSQVEESARFCQGIGFDGDSGLVEVPHNSAYALSEGTAVLWFNAQTLNNNGAARQALISKDHSNTGDERAANGDLSIFVEPDGRLRFEQYFDQQSLVLVTNRALIESETWHQLAYSWGPDGIEVFVDGNYIGGYPSPFTMSANTQPWRFGASVNQLTPDRSQPADLLNFFDGVMDEIRLYAGQLSGADVQSLYNASQYTCESCQITDAILFYRFEETDRQQNNIDDDSVNLQTGQLVGSAIRILPENPISCAVLDIPLNTDARTADAADTRFDMNDIGTQGTLSFWYRSNEPWVGGGNRQLFDASERRNPNRNNANSDKYFHLTLVNTGQLRFGLEESNDGDLQVFSNVLDFAAGEWVHIAVSFDVVTNEQALFINGSPVNWITNQASRLRGSQLGSLNSLYFGDNRSLYLVGAMTGNSANGQFDDIRVYNYLQTRTQVLADIDDVLECTGVHHYELTHPAQSLTCDAAPVVIKACANEACSELVSQPVTVQLNNGEWGNGNPVTFTGQLTTTLRQRNEQTVSLRVAGTDPDYAAQTPLICTNNCEIEFSAAGLVFFDTTTSAALLPDTIAQSDLGRIGLWAAKDEGGVCKALLNGAQTIDFSYQCYNDASAPYSSEQCQMPFAGVPVTGNGSGQNSGQLTLTFDEEGKTSLAGYQYADAGRLLLTASAQIDQTPFNSGTATFDSIPASLLFEPVMTSPQPAGAPFTIAISALGAQGAVLPGYQAGQLQASLNRQIPLDGVDGLWHLSDSQVIQSRTDSTFSDAPLSGFNNGVYEYTNSYFDEAGSFEALFQDADYLGNTISSSPVALSRFIPAYFDAQVTQPGQLADSCGAITYIGQPFGFELGAEPQIEVTALNALGQVTANYDSGLWQLAPDSAQIAGFSALGTSAYAANGPVTTNTAAMQALVTGTDNFDGQGMVTLTGPQFTYAKIATVSPGAGGGSPFAASLNANVPATALTDADGVCYRADSSSPCQALTISSIQGAQLHYGRLRLDNAYGPENEALNIPVVTEYYDGGNWLLAQGDSCTTLNLAQNNGQIGVANASQGSQETDISSAFTSLSVTSTLNQGSSADGEFVVGPALDGSGNGQRGTIAVTLIPGAVGERWSEYLNIDWNLDGVIDASDFPKAAVSFGLYRGNERTLHWRERF